MSKAWKICQPNFTEVGSKKQKPKKKIKAIQLDMFDKEKKKWTKQVHEPK